jgi:hypothetical protein
MRILSYFTLLFAVATLAVACKKGGNNTEAANAEGGSTANTEASSSNSGGGIDGAWKITDAQGTMASMNIGTEYTFSGNSLTMKGMGIETKYKLEVNGDNIKATLETDANFVMQWTYKMDGGKLILTGVGNDQVFTLERQ